AIPAFRALADSRGAGEAMVQLARTYWFRGETDRKRALLARAIEVLEREPPGRELALAYTHSAADHMVANRSAECAAWSEKALALGQQVGLGAAARPAARRATCAAASRTCATLCARAWTSDWATRRSGPTETWGTGCGWS